MDDEDFLSYIEQIWSSVIELIKNGGIILFDDYNWTHKTQVTKNGIEKFITEFNDKIIVLFRGPVQCAVKVK